MFDLLEHDHVQELHVCHQPDSQLNAFIAIHSTHLGPALGGCRFMPYPHAGAALRDAIRLARGMSYKAALAGVPQGGGKSVILRPEGHFDGARLFREFGRFIDTLGGRYITAIDAGTTAREMDWIAEETTHVTSTSDAGNPSAYTALGVYKGILAAVEHRFGLADLAGLRVLVQGLGNVGMRLAQYLHQAGAKLLVCDIDTTRVHQARSCFGAQVVHPDRLFEETCDIFAPCGLGGVINHRHLPEMSCAIVAGSANNQLEDADCGRWLHDEGILYAPDYVINAGGLIYASLTHSGSGISDIEFRVHQLGETLRSIFQLSEEGGLPTSEVSDALAEEKLCDATRKAA